MAEPPATTPAVAVPAERDALQATKLHMPRTRPGMVARPRLADRLAHAHAGDLTVVCAPAGFGKTTMLADWARRNPRPVAWLSLDDSDNDQARFWRHVAAALDRVCPGVAQRVAALLGPPSPRSFEGLVTALVNQLAGRAEEVVLVLDDYQLIQEPSVHASLGFLVDHLPPGLLLVLTSRTDPPLPLARLRARGQLVELREADLRFTPQEAAELLRTAAGPDLPETAVVALAGRTEGWAAGLQLAALSLRGQADIDAFVAEFSGSHRYVLDYLTEEILDRQPEPLRTFLLQTSPLERLSGPLCDAVCGRTDSQQLLERIERANLFLVPLDEVRGWWRYHQLFADLLRARLLQQQPGRLPALHRAAAVWFEEHGLVGDAVRHALAAAETGWAARLIERHFDVLLGRSEDPTLRRWLEALPAELVGSRPRLCLAQALLAAAAGDTDAIQPPLEAAERALADHRSDPEEPYEPSVGRAASLLANVPAAIALQRATLAHLQGDSTQTRAFARRAQAELDEGESTLASVTGWYLAVADWLGGRLAAAERAFASRVDGWLAAGQQTMAAWGYHYLAQLRVGQGRLGAALGTYQRPLDDAQVPGRPSLQVTRLAHVGMAGVLYERGELDSAHEHATEGIRLCRQFAYTPPLATGLAILAWIRRAQGDRAGAAATMREAERVEPSAAAVGLLDPMPALRARLALAQGEVAEAARWVQERGLEAGNEPTYPREREYLVLARVLLAGQAPDRALRLLERLHADAAAQGRTGSVIEVRVLQALALDAAGD